MSYARRPMPLVIALATMMLTVALMSPLPKAFAAQVLETASGPETGAALDYALSRPAHELSAAPDESTAGPRPPRINPLANRTRRGQRGTWNRPSVPARSADRPDRRTESPDAGARLRLRGYREPGGLRRLHATRHDRRRRPEPLRPDGQRDQGGASSTRPARCWRRAFNLGTLWPAGHVCAATPATPSCSTTTWPIGGCSASSRPEPPVLRDLADGRSAGQLSPLHVQRGQLPRLLQGRRVAERLLRDRERGHATRPTRSTARRCSSATRPPTS